MNKVFKVSVVIAGLLVLTGCGSLAGVAKQNVQHGHKLASDGTGVTYGAWLNGGTEGVDAVVTACKAIDNADPRCSSPEKYRLGNVASAFGFSAGLAGVLTLQPAEMNTKGCVTGSSKCTYFKVEVEKGKFGKILDVASVPGENKCYWSGLARAGGVVCPAYNWDYRKNLSDWDTSSGAMTVK